MNINILLDTIEMWFLEEEMTIIKYYEGDCVERERERWGRGEKEGERERHTQSQ